jgi:hypothetical protein
MTARPAFTSWLIARRASSSGDAGCVLGARRHVNTTIRKIVYGAFEK